MKMTIQSWPLTLLALVGFCLFVGLGSWQVARARAKQQIWQDFQARRQHPKLTAFQLDRNKDLRFYPASLQGRFDNAHSFFLDNKIVKGQVGYEIYTPFYALGLKTPILVDRGFAPVKDRKILPKITAIDGTVTITGFLNTPPGYFSLAKMQEPGIITWPQRFQYLDLGILEKILQTPMYPLILMPLADKASRDFFPMPPEKHLGYALQWFALALTLLILFVALNRKKAKKT